MAGQRPVSPRGAVIIGVFSAAMGLVIILVAAGVIPTDPRAFHAPRWVVGLAGLAFAGLALWVGYGLGRAGPDGELPAGTPLGVLVAQYLLGLGIVGTFALVGGWVAFGSGERAFRGSLSLPFLSVWLPSGESLGRLVFKIGTLLTTLFFVVIAVSGLRRIRGEWLARRRLARLARRDATGREPGARA
jgi:hypothetical protein